MDFVAIVCNFYHKLESNPPYPSPPLSQAPPDLLLCPRPTWSTHSAALITNCHLPSVGEADHLLQEKATTTQVGGAW